MPTTLNSGLQLPDKGSVDWYSSMQNNYNLLDNHLENTNIHVTAEDKANWDSKQGSLSQAQLDAIAQVATNTSDISALQSGKANTSHTHSSSDITDIGDYATKQYVDNSISGLVDNAPDALNTLNELSAALNDDSNFASTVTTALAAKANSADLATVATSGSYTDLTDKPTINDSTITIQKNGSTVDTFTTNGSAKTINITVPTKTSDLTNDSNFVDTSNSAVSSGITSAKVTSYDSHIADTDIHVTTADKNKWNNQTYVFRYSSTELTASSTNSNTLLDNTDNLKVGDKVIDSSGVLFSITAIDTANSTFTVGSALVDLALDGNVVHNTGDETVGGKKELSEITTFAGSYLGNESSTNERTNFCLRSNRDTADKSGAYISRFRPNKNQGALSGSDNSFISISFLENETRYTRCFDFGLTDWDSDGIPQTYYFTSPGSKGALGTSSRKWQSINGLAPSSLGMPDLDNGVDISSYITVVANANKESLYTPPANGWISVALTRTGGSSAAVMLKQGNFASSGHKIVLENGTATCNAMLPVKGGVQVSINSALADGIAFAYFYPCLGNV